MPVGFFFSQLKKLGKQLPDQILPAPIRTAFQEMWASNGDAISRQYAGTAAMKVPRRKSLFPFIYYAPEDREHSTSFPESLLFPSPEAGNKANPENEVDKYPFV